MNIRGMEVERLIIIELPKTKRAFVILNNRRGDYIIEERTSKTLQALPGVRRTPRALWDTTSENPHEASRRVYDYITKQQTGQLGWADIIIKNYGHDKAHKLLRESL